MSRKKCSSCGGFCKAVDQQWECLNCYRIFPKRQYTSAKQARLEQTLKSLLGD